MAIVSGAVNPESEAVLRLTEKVEAHTPSYAAKVLTVLIPVLGWIGGGLYLLYQDYQKSEALKKLAAAVKALKIEANTPQDIQAIYSKAVGLLLKPKLESLDNEYKSLDNKYKSLLKDHQKKTKIFQKTAITEIARIFGPLWNSPKFATDVFLEYLKIAQSPKEEEESLIHNSSHAIQADKIGPLRESLKSLEAKLKENPKLLVYFSASKDPTLALARCLQEEADPERYSFERGVEKELRSIFGDLWSPAFATQIFPIYLEIALALNGLENPPDNLDELLSLLPDETVNLIPNNHKIEAAKVQTLQSFLSSLKDRLSQQRTIREKYTSDLRLVGDRRALEMCIKSAIFLSYQDTSLQVGAGIYTNIGMLNAYYKDGRYLNIPDKTEVFKIALELRESDDFHEILDRVIEYMSINKEGFIADFEARKKGIAAGILMNDRLFWKQCEMRYKAAAVPAT